jgi:hypothetical protein
MRQRFALALGLLLLAATARADDSALRRCRLLTEAAPRLACYDALPLPAVAPAPVAAPAAGPAQPPAAFGLSRKQEEPKEMASRIPGRFDGWRPGQRFRLENGQLWQVSDDSSAAYDLLDPKVTVRRGALGSFWLDVDGTRHSPRVRRIE